MSGDTRAGRAWLPLGDLGMAGEGVALALGGEGVTVRWWGVPPTPGDAEPASSTDANRAHAQHHALARRAIVAATGVDPTGFGVAVDFGACHTPGADVEAAIVAAVADGAGLSDAALLRVTREVLGNAGRPCPQAAALCARRGGWALTVRRWPSEVLHGTVPDAWRVMRATLPSQDAGWRRSLRDRVHPFRAAEDAARFAGLVAELCEGAVRPSHRPSRELVTAASRALPALHPLLAALDQVGVAAVWFPGLDGTVAVLVDEERISELAQNAVEAVLIAHAIEPNARTVGPPRPVARPEKGGMHRTFEEVL